MKFKSFGILVILSLLPLFVTAAKVSSPNLSVHQTSQPERVQLTSVFPKYGPITNLLEEVNGTQVELQSAYIDTATTFERRFGSFKIIKENGQYVMWVNNRISTDASHHQSVEQRLVSDDGFVWYDRTNTNLTFSGQLNKFGDGIRAIIQTDSGYEAWQQYYYEWSVGWGYAINHVTSTDGINWTILKQPVMIGTTGPNVIKEGNYYKLWAEPHGTSQWAGDRALRYRTSGDPANGWGDWQTGGTKVNVDGAAVSDTTYLTRVRKLDNGTYQLFYLTESTKLNVATSQDGINFTLQQANILDLNDILPDTANYYIAYPHGRYSGQGHLLDYDIVEVNGETWFYFTSCATLDETTNRCLDPRLGVSRPAKQNSITLVNKMNPPEPDGVDFEGDLGTFTLGDGEQTTINDLNVGTYQVREIRSSLPASTWALLYVRCVDQNDSTASPVYPKVTQTTASFEFDIDLIAGQALLCTFHNEQVNLVNDGTFIYLPIILTDPK